jgi:hypothetical protein
VVRERKGYTGDVPPTLVQAGVASVAAKSVSEARTSKVIVVPAGTVAFHIRTSHREPGVVVSSTMDAMLPGLE